MYLLPPYNVPLYNVFLPITFDFPGPKDDLDLSVTFCDEICPVQWNLKSLKREEKQREREYIDRPLEGSTMQSPRRLTLVPPKRYKVGDE